MVALARGTGAAVGQWVMGAQTEQLVLHLLHELIAILAVTQIMVWVSKRFFAQTNVVGEILAGLMLGPSLLGYLFPQTMRALFVPETSAVFVGIAQIGLILLMFQIGLEFEFKSTLLAGRHAVIVISLAGLAVPFVLGYLTAPWFWSRIAEPRPDMLAFQLVFAAAMSITAVPVLGRILIELGLSHTRTAALTIGAAAIEDVCGWLILGVVAAIVTSNFLLGLLTARVGGLVLYAIFVFLVLRPGLRTLLRNHLAQNGRLVPSGMSWIFILLLCSASITSKLGVFAIIRGFIIGLAL